VECLGISEQDANWLVAGCRTITDIHGYAKAFRDGIKFFNRAGFDRAGFNRAGFDRAGFNRDGFDRDGFDRDGFDCDGFDRDGFDCDGFDRDGVKLEKL
jgi:hypothetical protein